MCEDSRIIHSCWSEINTGDQLQNAPCQIRIKYHDGGLKNQISGLAFWKTAHSISGVLTPLSPSEFGMRL